MKFFLRLFCLVSTILANSLAGFSVKPAAPINDPGKATITFKLSKGSRLFFSYPQNIVQFKELLLDNVSRDSSFTITVNTKVPFVIYNSNKTHTPYLFFPGYIYTAEIRKGEVDITFQCADRLKAFECNALREVEEATMRFELSLNKNATKYLYQSRQYSRPLDSFLLALKNKRHEKIEDYRKANKLSEEGYRFLHAYINYDFIGKRLIPFYYPNFDLKNMPAWYADTMRQYQRTFDDSSMLRLYSFQGALVYDNRFLGTDPKKGTSSLARQFAVAKNFTGSSQVNNFLLYQILNNHKNKEDSEYPMYVDSFKLFCTDTLYKTIIQKNFEYLAKEKTLSAAVQQLFTMQSKMADFDSLISRQKKLIYIDCWANWCVPCKKEMPFSVKLQREFAGKDISFLFFSLDGSATQWEAAAGDYDFMNSGNSFLVTGNFQSPFVKKHQIRTIPRYILMSNDGKIIDDDAPRPGDPKLRDLINRNL
ncbi:TlpA family protein disulfide reductase [Chitinophaga polysaccharea]|nr:TlpA disulfide reductase family protein [Chitinophaga polysaccharea]